MSYYIKITREGPGDDNYDEDDNPLYPPITAEELEQLAASDPEYVLHRDEEGMISWIEFPEGSGDKTGMYYNGYTGTLSYKTHRQWKQLLPAFRSLALKPDGTSIRGEEGEIY